MRQFHASGPGGEPDGSLFASNGIGGTRAGDWRLIDVDGSQHRKTRTPVGRVDKRGKAILRMSVGGLARKVVGVAVKRPMQPSKVGQAGA